MKKQTFYPTIWSPMPFNFGFLAQGDINGRRIKEVILNNQMVAELGVSEMELNINRFAAFDIHGNEHHILDFPGQSALKIQGMASGNFLRSRKSVNLNSGTYTTFRFYLNKENKFTYNDGLVEDVFSYDHLDFTIENNLIIDGSQPLELKFWFDFAPFKLSSYFKSITDLFRKEGNQRPRLARGY
ncbi:hypothetical protein [Croceivirga thetidis]|uniref:Uncharacterized protein n=1 Tax=Croceivirga thetidis TaxID=2721623 RepID=A0ABX1GPG4_9FLAO|nr:hypothetical protein [Croceivirga thetidis]NKI30657.1 hypothetical protein [Croceivirga thetidis]